MNKSSKIRDLMRGITGTDKLQFNFLSMEVVSVEGDLCKAKIDDFEIPDIRLSAIVGGSENGILIAPAVGSIVIVADLSCGTLRELIVIGYSEIDSIKIHKNNTTISVDGDSVKAEVGNSIINITDGLIEINGGKNNGLVKIGSLVERLNKIEGDLNTIKGLLSGWTPVNPAESDAKTLKAALTLWASQTITPTRPADIENPKIKH